MKWTVCFLSGLVALLSVSVSGHQWKFGKCISTPRKSDLDTERFLGSWFVIEQIDTSSECLTLNYDRKSSSQLQVTKVRQHPLIKKLGVEHTNKYTGKLDVPATNQARMRVKWSLNPLKGDYTIVDTDYDTYALIFECQQLTPLNHRYSAAILSRDSTLPVGTITEMKTILRNNGVNTSKFNKVNHSPCTSPKTTTTDDSTTEAGTTTPQPNPRNPTPERSDPTPDGSDSTPDGSDPTPDGSDPTPDGSDSTPDGSDPTPDGSNTNPAEPNPPTDEPNENPGREPLDENPVVPDGNPDEIPDVDIDETLNEVDESINYIDGTNNNDESQPRSFPDDNSASPPSEPEAPVEDPTVPPREPEVPVDDPTVPPREPEAPVEDPTVPPREPEVPVDDPSVPPREPEVPAETTTLPPNDVRRTVVSGI